MEFTKGLSEEFPKPIGNEGIDKLTEDIKKKAKATA